MESGQKLLDHLLGLPHLAGAAFHGVLRGDKKDRGQAVRKGGHEVSWRSKVLVSAKK